MNRRSIVMEPTAKPYVHLSIHAVDAVAFDPEGRHDADRHDRYATFGQARDAALTSIEVMLDEGDHDGEEHKEELEQMLGLLEAASSFEDLEGQSDYRRLLERLVSAVPAPA
jgi:hypothetical protein